MVCCMSSMLLIRPLSISRPLTTMFFGCLQASIAQVLGADHGQVVRLVEAAVAVLTAGPESGVGSATPADAVQLLNDMDHNHGHQLLPALRAADGHFAAFCEQCVANKVQRH